MARTDPERAARLAAALRDNLKRRKAQARAVAPSRHPRESEDPATLSLEGKLIPRLRGDDVRGGGSRP